MKSFSQLFLTIIITIGYSVSALAQTATLYGDENQPGNRLHDQIVILESSGVSTEQAIAQAINESLEEQSTILGGQAKSAVSFDIEHSNAFYDEMVASNSLIEVTKVLAETFNEKLIHTITLGVVLYPDYAQDVFDGAALTGLLAPEDILVAVIQAGADPSTVSDAPAGGLPTPGGVLPIGPGLGGGGTGGGDTTASTN